MDAIISGRAGVAVLVEGDRFHSFDVEEPGELRPRQASEVHLLFGDAPDVRVLKDVTREEAARNLERDADCADALDLALILLDPEMSSDIHDEAAVVLDGLLRREGVPDYLQNVLYARPLPPQADPAAAAADLRPELPRLDALFTQLAALQPAVAAVWRAWEAIPASAFPPDAARGELQREAVARGVFRRVAESYPRLPTPQSFGDDLCARFGPALTCWRAALDACSRPSGRAGS